jgi:hypothetical protein
METRAEFEQALRNVKSLGSRTENLTAALRSAKPGDAGWKPLMLEMDRLMKDFATLFERSDVKQVMKGQVRTMHTGMRELEAAQTRVEEFLYRFSKGPDQEEATATEHGEWLKIIGDGKAAASKILNQWPAINLPPESRETLLIWGAGFDLNYLHNLRKRWKTEAAVEEFNAVMSAEPSKISTMEEFVAAVMPAPKPEPKNPVLEKFASDAAKNNRISDALEKLLQP